MRIVLDASAAIEVVLNRSKSSALADLLSQAEEVLAPDLLVSEATNVIWKCHRFEGLDRDSCEQALNAAVTIPDRLIPSVALYREAFLLAEVSKRPAYDMFYVALARREDAALLTLDAGLKSLAAKQGVRVIG
jgi:predicted nucleic acid-binding protein